MRRVLLFGCTGGIGEALLHALLNNSITEKVDIIAPVRSGSKQPGPFKDSNTSFTPLVWNTESPDHLGEVLEPHAHTPFDTCLCAIGGLHHAGAMPEKKLSQITVSSLQWAHYTNTILPTMVIKHTAHLMTKDTPSVMGILSARVGSIGDNRLGGWYAYRSAKSALHMIIKSAAIEMKRYNPKLSIVGIHPGTVDTPLSAPFKRHVNPSKLFTPQTSAEYIFNHIITKVTPAESGHIFAWDGKRIPD